MVGTVATGWLGMNLYGLADRDPWTKTWIFLAVFLVVTAVTATTVVLSRRLAKFMEALASERLTWAEKRVAFGQIWRRSPRRRSRGFKRVAGGDEPARRNAGPIERGKPAQVR
jgi:hypothetical protein